MPKGYWITSYRSISDPEKLKAYAKLAPRAIAAFGGRFLARGTPAGTGRHLRIPERREGHRGA